MKADGRTAGQAVWIVVVLLTAGPPGRLTAQTEGSVLAGLPGSTRAAGLGGAGAALVGDAGAMVDIHGLVGTIGLPKALLRAGEVAEDLHGGQQLVEEITP